jgi:hypothetical protein
VPRKVLPSAREVKRAAICGVPVTGVRLPSACRAGKNRMRATEAGTSAGGGVGLGLLGSGSGSHCWLLAAGAPGGVAVAGITSHQAAVALWLCGCDSDPGSGGRYCVLRIAGDPPSLLTPQFPGVLVARWAVPTPHVRNSQVPPNVIKSSTSNSAGSWGHGSGSPSVGVLGLSLSTPPPGHPAARRCVRAVPVLPLLLCTRPARARARPSVGGQSPTPAPRQLPCPVESSPGPPEHTVRFIDLALRASTRQIEIETIWRP